MSHNTTNILPDDMETDITDITITPDGRIRCFGLSRQLLALLCETGLADEQLQKHWEAITGPQSEDCIKKEPQV
jgi:hypothetical protein